MATADKEAFERAVKRTYGRINGSKTRKKNTNLDSKTRPNVSDYLLGHLQVIQMYEQVLSIRFITSRSSLFLARRSKVDPAPTTLPRCGMI